ncbi:DUF309 domain-containing protein [Paenibacillus humicola]|uniref:DUF309 domain-containing protein n=1 Tax=Paenibacillus humicola TaxID=3110540 RepID=UPI00237A76B2|nr:DUF309 domain-containing protein [Paenibacillus humicola]
MGFGGTHYPEAYIDYLIEFHGTRDFFECHELLEEYWKEHPGDPQADGWVGLIQLAVGAYHYRRGNRQGAAKMLRSAASRLTAERLEALGLKGAQTAAAIEGMIRALDDGLPYADIDLIFRDGGLLDACRGQCAARGHAWGAPSPELEALVHRHTLRDRSDVIEARRAASAARRNGNEGGG